MIGFQFPRSLAGIVLFVLLLSVQGVCHAQKWNGSKNQDEPIWRKGNVSIGAEPSSVSTTFEITRPISGSDNLIFSINAPFKGANNNRFEVDSKRAYAGGARSKKDLLKSDVDLAVHRSAVIGVVNFTDHMPNDYQLTVGGKILAEEVRIKLIKDWADYVFADDYRLRDLQDVEIYIQTHRHLPEIPSASEVATSGFELGEMNAKLLAKIEELTLYLIEQNKKIAQLNQKVNKLEQVAIVQRTVAGNQLSQSGQDRVNP